MKIINRQKNFKKETFQKRFPGQDVDRHNVVWKGNESYVEKIEANQPTETGQLVGENRVREELTQLDTCLERAVGPGKTCKLREKAIQGHCRWHEQTNIWNKHLRGVFCNGQCRDNILLHIWIMSLRSH